MNIFTVSAKYRNKAQRNADLCGKGKAMMNNAVKSLILAAIAGIGIYTAATMTRHSPKPYNTSSKLRKVKQK